MTGNGSIWTRHYVATFKAAGTTPAAEAKPPRPAQTLVSFKQLLLLLLASALAGLTVPAISRVLKRKGFEAR